MSESVEKVKTFGYTEERVRTLFSTKSLSDSEKALFLELKYQFEVLAMYVLKNTPNTPHQTIAINKIIEAKDAACLGFITAL